MCIFFTTTVSLSKVKRNVEKEEAQVEKIKCLDDLHRKSKKMPEDARHEANNRMLEKQKFST